MCEEDVLRHVDEVWVVFKPPTAESCWAPAMVSQDFQTSTCTRSVVEVIDLTMPGNLNDHKLQRDRKDWHRHMSRFWGYAAQRFCQFFQLYHGDFMEHGSCCTQLSNILSQSCLNVWNPNSNAQKIREHRMCPSNSECHSLSVFEDFTLW
jgi:hypothetical protein